MSKSKVTIMKIDGVTVFIFDGDTDVTKIINFRCDFENAKRKNESVITTDLEVIFHESYCEQ